MSSSRDSGLSTYSPISTLERQYTGAGQRVCLFVKTNANCCLTGGVEGILKQRKSGNTLLAKEQQDLGGPLGASSTSTNGDGSSAAAAAAAAAAADPFSFLNTSDDEDDEVDNDPNEAKKGSKFGRFFKKVATKTTKTLERGMHGLAIRADQGRNSDLLMVGLYDDKEALITMTESVPLPQDDQHRLQGIRFVIPLVLPLDQDSSRQVSVKLWIRSGAALLQQTNAAKNYLIGSVHLSAGQIRQSLQSTGGSTRTDTSASKPAAFFHATLQSALVADGQLTFCATPDPKFPAVCTRGWSLTDPDIAQYKPVTSTGVGTTGGSGLYNLPLDQPYGFAVPNKNAACLVAVERSIESTVVLPIAAAFGQLSAAAAKSSLARGETMAGQVLANRHDVAVGEYADCNVGIGFLKLSDPSTMNAGGATATPIVTASWQRPDSIFEVELLPPTKVALQPFMGEGDGAFQPSSSFRFFPKPCRKDVLPGVLQAAGGQMPPTGFLGNIRLAIAIPKPKSNGVHVENPFGMVSGASQAPGAAQEEDWECIIALESLAQRSPNSNPVFEFPVRIASTGQIVGSVIVSLTIQVQQGPAVPSNIPPAQEGLVSLTGLLPLTDCVLPELDFDSSQSHAADPSLQRRHQQMATMGYFVTHTYMEQHVTSIRAPDATLLEERATRYRAALATSTTEGKLPAHLDRSPKPFRPSASRTEVLLSGIGFNVHIASLEVKVLDPDMSSVPTGALFHNITCGAPADHARGFGDVFATKKDPTVAKVGFNSPVGSAAGGLRRLEAKRDELAREVTNLQTSLTMGVANYFGSARQGNKPVNHVPSRHAELAALRWKVFEAVQALNHLTWICAVRRASTFSQALGIAVSSYLTSLSDAAKLESKWPDFWARHGYLITYEGMLSAAGKELGMIEDASVAISMLRNVKLVLVSDDGATSASRVPVPSSPYLRWVDLSVSKVGPETSYTLQIGVIPSYYDQRIPMALKNGISVTLYPVLFEVGVDIRQWGSYAGSNMKSQLVSASGSEQKVEQKVGGMLEDEDDDEGVTDDDVLVQLNYEAFRKMNAYAFAVSPSNTPQSPQKTHPMLETLYQHIVSSSGKMNHDILDEAAGLAQQLGGGGAVFCKSGKDRTAMHVTYKKAQFANRYRQHHHSVEGDPTVDSTLTDAMIMRLYGTRLPICEKNVGQAKYAFNSLQVKFMPDALKPPMSALAGFLKGGKVFSSGGIES
jgi:hypothetical protein